MGDTQQWISIDECIASYLDRSEQSQHKKFKCWNLAFDGMRQMGLDFFYAVRSVKIPMNSNFTAFLPEDYQVFTKVGVFNDRSELIPLYRNDKLTWFDDQLSTRIQNTEDTTLLNFYTPNSTIFYNYWDGDTMMNLYGIPSGAPFVGEFNIDNRAGLILLGPNFSYAYVVLEYLSSPAPYEGTYRLPVQFKEALIWFIAWQDIAMMPNTRKGALGDKEERRNNFFNERRTADARYRPFYLEEAYEENLRMQRATVKA